MRAFRKFLRLNQGIIIPAVMLLFSVFVSILVLYPVSQQTWDLIQDVNTERTEIVGLQTKLNQLQALDEETLRQQLRLLTSAIPTEKSLATLLSTAEVVSANTGATLSDLSLINPGSLATDSAKRQTSEEKTFGAALLPFSVVLTGSEQQIRNYLSTSINVRRLLRIKQFTVVFSGDGNARSNVSLDALYAGLPTNLGDVKQPIVPLTEKDEQLLDKLAAQPNYSQELLAPPAAAEQPFKADPFSP